jgi:hypothetical protein
MSENLFPRRPPAEIVAELFRSCAWEEAGDPSGAAHKAADWLFSELIERIGVDDARKIFLHVIDELSDHAEKHETDMLLFRLNMMRDKKTGKRKANVQALARIIAAENDAFNKSPERNGAPARSTNQPSIEKQIIRVRNANGAHWSAAQGQSPQPRKKKKTAKKTPLTSKQHQPKRKIIQS